MASDGAASCRRTAAYRARPPRRPVHRAASANRLRGPVGAASGAFHTGVARPPPGAQRL